MAQAVLSSDFKLAPRIINGDTGFFESSFCGHHESAWKASNAWACSFCNLLNTMGHWQNDTLELVLPSEISFQVAAYYDNATARHKVLAQYIIQEVLGDKLPNFVLGASRCNGLLRVVQHPFEKSGWETIAMPEVMSAARKLRERMWSHARAWDPDAVVSGGGHIAFAMQENVSFCVSSPAEWVGSDLAFYQYRTGLGYAGYTEACLLLAAARVRGKQVQLLSQWVEVFPKDADAVFSLVATATDWNEYTINDMLRGITICSLHTK